MQPLPKSNNTLSIDLVFC